MTDVRHSGTIKMLQLDTLLLDWDNPRFKPGEKLPPDVAVDEAEGQRRLALLMDERYHPLSIAESIAEHEFFHSEPLIAVPHGSKYRVIEGNRRLTALKGLVDRSLRADFARENRRWAELPEYVADPGGYPVLVVPDASRVAALLGFRHISGIEPWAAYAQGRYIRGLVEEGKTFDQIAELVGKSRTQVASMYRNIDILEQGAEQFGVDTSRAIRSFGVFNNAMSRQGIRDYLKAPMPREVDPDLYPLPDDAGERLAEVLVFMFGDASGEGRVVSDSRQLGDLSKILANPVGEAMSVLRSTLDLDQALNYLEGVDERINRAIGSCIKALGTVSPADLQTDEISEATIGRWSTLMDSVAAFDAVLGGRA
ncbi:MAG: hypothetical protein ACXVHX_17115 [Solirubrobacteraceae bacterium]